MELSIIIVNWNSARFLAGCIESIHRHTAQISYEIIVIDSGSYDGCSTVLALQHPEVTFMQCERNVGFARANNLAFKASRGQHLLFLNPDTELMSPAINAMLEHVQRSGHTGAVGCKLFNGDGSLQISCVQAFPTIFNQLLNSDALHSVLGGAGSYSVSSLLQSNDGPLLVDVVSGACMMMSRDAFQRAGGFSEDYFMFAEDVDLCHKLNQAGYRNYCVPQAAVRHVGGACTARAPGTFSFVMARESMWRFLCKSRGKLYGFAYRLSMLLSALARLPLLIIFAWWEPADRRRAVHKDAIGKWIAILGWSLKITRVQVPR